VKYLLSRYQYLLLRMAHEGRILGLVVGPRPAAEIYDIPEGDIPEWLPAVCAKMPGPQTNETLRRRLEHIVKVLEHKNLLKRKWLASKPTRTLSWTITNKGVRWLGKAKNFALGRRAAPLKGTITLRWRASTVGGRQRWYCPALLDYDWQGIIEKKTGRYRWQLTNPEGVCSGWIEAEIPGIVGAKAEVEATFRKYL
jgi:hypothetical protein